MPQLQKISAGIMVAGFVLFAVGGMHIRGGPDGTWFQVYTAHWLGGGLILVGLLLSIVASCVSGARAD